jgi:ParB family chromosome partitioning protein
MRVIEVREVEIRNIRIPEWGKRIVVSEHEVDEIAESIRSNTQIEPIVVRRLDDGGYELISGFMRLNALKRLGCETVEAKIIECSDEEALTISLDENLKRSNMHPFDIARKIEYMHRSLGLSVREIGRRLGRDASWVSMMLAIGSLCDEAKEILAPRIKDIPTLYEVSKLRDSRDQVLASRIIAEHGLGRREASCLVKEIMEKGSEAVEREYERFLEESKAMGEKGLYNSEVFNMLNTSQEDRGRPREPAHKPQAPVEAQEVRTCDICGERRPREGVKFIAICRDRHEALHDLIKVFRRHGFEDADKALEYVVMELEALLSYPRDQLSAAAYHLSEIAKMVKGLDIEMLRELVKEVRGRYAEG